MCDCPDCSGAEWRGGMAESMNELKPVVQAVTLLVLIVFQCYRLGT